MVEGRLDFGDAADWEAKIAPQQTTAATVPAQPRMKPIDRDQCEFRTFALDELIGEDHPARALWDFLGGLDLSEFEKGIQAVEGRAGQAAIQPRLLIALWLQACSDGVGSAREVSRRCGTHPAYRWLCGDEAINHHSLSDFRVQQREALDQLFIEVLAALNYQGLISLERVTHDGTRIRAAASRGSFHREKTIEESYAEAAAKVAAQGDPEQEAAQGRVEAARWRRERERAEKLGRAREVVQQLQASKAKAEEKKQTRASITEPDARIMKMPDKSFAPAYNAQFTTAADHGIIIEAEVTQQGSDFGQLLPALEGVKQKFGQLPDQTLVDGGYMSRENILELDGRTDLIGPFDEEGKNATERRRRNGIAAEYATEMFVFDAATNRFVCPQGCTLTLVRRIPGIGKIEHQYRAQETDCAQCRDKGRCCPKTAARRLTRIEEAEAVVRLRRKMASEAAKAVYKIRAQVAEFPNCWIKEKFGLRRFHVRGREKVQMETLWHVIAYNVQQWI